MHINSLNPNSLSIVTEQEKSFKILQLPLLSRELGLNTPICWPILKSVHKFVDVLVLGRWHLLIFSDRIGHLFKFIYNCFSATIQLVRSTQCTLFITDKIEPQQNWTAIFCITLHVPHIKSKLLYPLINEFLSRVCFQNCSGICVEI